MTALSLPSLDILLPDRPSPALAYAAEELLDYARRHADIPARLNPPDPGGIRVAVGAEQARRLCGEELLSSAGLTPELGDEGYLLFADAARADPVIVAAGHTEAGTRLALLRLTLALDVTTRPASLRGARAHDQAVVERAGAPFRRLRGMYAHQHWAYRHPYALRTWSVEEWKQYVDILAYFRLNLHSIWSMAGLLPTPLSPSDEAFLNRYPPLIDHARTRHGFEVWIGECGNNVATARDLPPVDARDYFEAEVRIDPSDPGQFAPLEASRRVFYSIVNNADGYWVIDSDPGGWEGSPAGGFVRILQMNRRLISECALKGPEAKLIYWMWCGWGTGTRAENLRDTVRGLLEAAPEPLWFTADWPEHMEAAEEAGLSGNVVFYPYGAIEPEPSQPFTDVIPDRLRACVRRGNTRPGWPGLMGNAQSPLVQLPNIHFLANAAWTESAVERRREESVRELARMIAPQSADLLAAGWMALKSDRPDDIREVARALEDRVRQHALGIPGPVGGKLFPDMDRLAEDLAHQLAIHAAGEEFKQKARDAGCPDSEALAPLREYVLRSTAWRTRNGFKMFPGDPVTSESVKIAADRRWASGERLREDIAADVRKTIEERHPAKEADFYLAWFGKNFYNRDGADG